VRLFKLLHVCNALNVAWRLNVARHIWVAIHNVIQHRKSKKTYKQYYTQVTLTFYAAQYITYCTLRSVQPSESGLRNARDDPSPESAVARVSHNRLWKLMVQNKPHCPFWLSFPACPGHSAPSTHVKHFSCTYIYIYIYIYT